jgi:hypothetical protein
MPLSLHGVEVLARPAEKPAAAAPPRAAAPTAGRSSAPFGIAAVLVALALAPAPPAWHAVGTLGIMVLLVALLPWFVTAGTARFERLRSSPPPGRST